MSTNKEYKIAIIGPTETVSGFKALGAVAYDATSGVQAIEHLRAIKETTNNPDTNERYAVVCIIEDLMKDIDETEYAKVATGALPAVVLLPGTNGSQGYAIKRLRQMAEQAVGAAII